MRGFKAKEEVGCRNLGFDLIQREDREMENKGGGDEEERRREELSLERLSDCVRACVHMSPCMKYWLASLVRSVELGQYVTCC